MAATTAAARGHDVTLFEAQDRIGGQLTLAAKVPGKEEFTGLLAWFAQEIARTGVDLRLSTRANAGELAGFDDVVVATGVTPRLSDIPGADLPHVANYADVLEGRFVPGARVAILGTGGIGHDVAVFLTHEGATRRSTCRNGVRNGGVFRS
ncbi:FAD-dependent oxidoreductase [Sulfitobacter porphyrae]|uniref:FAD-dependent oxidoreductase n=1 Tax=Sulfitobacter porphyrae TaxID=1246864 RepID=A0ABW2B791_9RHOB